MTASAHDFPAVVAAAAQHGLLLRGGFIASGQEQAPAVRAGRVRGAAKYLLLFGNAGASMWAAFKRSAEYREQRPHPLDRWSARLGGALAAEFSARAVLPFAGPPYPPFLAWAKRAEGLHNSQLGMLMHPRFGLWHAYRFALVFAAPQHSASRQSSADSWAKVAFESAESAESAESVAESLESIESTIAATAESAATEAAEAAVAAFESPPKSPPKSAAKSPPEFTATDLCARCRPKPCLAACPVRAFTPAGYDAPACHSYLAAHPQSACMTGGCLARTACPVGAAHRYAPSHAAFHMRAFLASRPVG